jgi:hypothetical protein
VHAVISKLIFHLTARQRHRLFGLDGRQLSINRPQVVQQKAQRFDVFR